MDLLSNCCCLDENMDSLSQIVAVWIRSWILLSQIIAVWIQFVLFIPDFLNVDQNGIFFITECCSADQNGDLCHTTHTDCVAGTLCVSWLVKR